MRMGRSLRRRKRIHGRENTWFWIWLALFKAAGQGSPSFAQETSIRELLIDFQPEEKYNGKWKEM